MVTRREKASRHASRSWTCVCGRTVLGNGGKSSHQRACRIWKEAALVRLENRIAATEAMTPADRWYRLEQATLPSLRQRAERMRRELGESGA